MSDDAKGFYRAFKNYLKREFPDAELIGFKPNHYDFSGFICQDGKYIYISHDIDRGRGYVDFNDHDPMNGVLYRTAEGPRDYHGGHNNFCSIKNLGDSVRRLFDRMNNFDVSESVVSRILNGVPVREALVNEFIVPIDGTDYDIDPFRNNGKKYAEDPHDDTIQYQGVFSLEKDYKNTIKKVVVKGKGYTETYRKNDEIKVNSGDTVILYRTLKQWWGYFDVDDDYRFLGDAPAVSFTVPKLTGDEAKAFLCITLMSDPAVNDYIRLNLDFSVGWIKKIYNIHKENL